MKARNVMTADVVPVAPDATICEAAEVMLRYSVSALPVIDGSGNLAGIISEVDLIRCTELGTAEQPRSWWLRPSMDEATSAPTYVKCHARRVRDVMNRNVITIIEDAPLSEVAAQLAKHRIERAPVVRDSRVVGMISRADLIRALASTPPAVLPVSPDDSAIRAAVLNDIMSWQRPSMIPVSVSVDHGVVELWGTYRSEEEHLAVRIAAENVFGVQSIRDHRISMSTFAADA